MNINWYPGHMKKTKESLEKMIKLVDAVIEIRDARAPYSTKNPILKEIIRNKPLTVLLNKSDLADPAVSKRWIDKIKNENVNVIEFNAKNNIKTNELIIKTKESVEKYYKENKAKSFDNKIIKAMVVGIPNVGKSTLINLLNKKKSLKVGNKPGITKTNQWIKISESFMLLDTPGVLWPKFESDTTALNLCFIGSIKDDILNKDDIALKLIEFLNQRYKEAIMKRYRLDRIYSPLQTLEEIAKKRGFILKGGEYDYDKSIVTLLDEFKKGELGRISLEDVYDEQGN